MKKVFLVFAIVLLGLCGSIYLVNPKQESTNTGINKMAGPSSVYWIGANGNTYVKTAGTGTGGVQDYGKLPAGSSIAGSTLIADPNPPQTSQLGPTSPSNPTSDYYYPSSGGTAAAPAPPPIDYAALAQYDQSIGNVNAAVNRLPAQQASGNSTIDASYQNALNQLLGAKNQANATYDTNVTQNKQDYVGSKNTIRSQAGGSLNGLLRLLGSRGAGGGSAATITAPGAVARLATQQQTDVGNTYGHNSQDLDTNWNNYLTGYNNQVSSAGNQRDTQRQSLQQQIDSNKASLLQQLAQLSGQRAQVAGGSATGAAQPYINQANSVLDQTSHYTTAPINYQTQAYTAPSLDHYTFNPAGAPTAQGQAQTNDYTSPYLATLLKQKQSVAGVTA